MRNTYHICLASHDEVLHRSVEDYIYDVNCFAVAVYRTESRALADAFMSTHDHACVQTDDVAGVASIRRNAYTRYFNAKYERTGRLGEHDCFITELEGIRRITAAVSYVNRNPLHHGLTSTPFGYRFCSANAIFRNELGKGEATPAASQAIRHRFLPRNCSLPDTFRIDDSGMILHEDIIDVRYVEELYVTPRSYLYMMNRYSDEKWMKEQLEEDPLRPAVTLDMIEQNTVEDFDYFNRDGINNFIIYLRDSGGLQENSFKKQYKNLLWFMNWAIRKGYTRETTIQTYKPKFKLVEKTVIFLSREELLTVYKVPKNGTKVKLKDLNGNEYEKEVEEACGLERARDLFCFCAFTSIRYSDMAELRRANIDGDIMHITTQKTHDSLDIDLTPLAKAILEKYKDEQFPDGCALPVISNQKMNNHLKDLFELCGINSPLTETCIRNGKRETEVFPKWAKVGTHAGRRTFICFALASGIPPQVVMKWTGHSDYKSMKPYIDIATRTKSDAMAKIAASWEEEE